MCQKNCCTESWYYPQNSLLFVHTSPLSNCTLFVIRVIFALYLNGAQLYRFYENYKTLFHMINFMTNLGLFITSFYFLLVVQDRIFGYKYNDTQNFSLYRMRNFIITLFEISFSFQVVITIVYWAFLFDGETDPLKLYLDTNGHGIPLLGLLLDFIFNSYDFSIKRYLLSLIFASIYMIINLIYTLTNEPVYDILTWTNGFSYGLVIAAFAVGLVAFGLGILSYHCFCKKKKIF